MCKSQLLADLSSKQLRQVSSGAIGTLTSSAPGKSYTVGSIQKVSGSGASSATSNQHGNVREAKVGEGDDTDKVLQTNIGSIVVDKDELLSYNEGG